jgi:hypothetical protein
MDARACSVRRISTKRRSRSSRSELGSFAAPVEVSSNSDRQSHVSIVELGCRSGDLGVSGGRAPTVRIGVSASMAPRVAAAGGDSNSRNPSPVIHYGNTVARSSESGADPAVFPGWRGAIALHFSRRYAQTPQTRPCPADINPAAAVCGDRLAGADPPGAARVALLPDGDLARPVRPRAPGPAMGPHRHRGAAASIRTPIPVRRSTRWPPCSGPSAAAATRIAPDEGATPADGTGGQGHSDSACRDADETRSRPVSQPRPEEPRRGTLPCPAGRHATAHRRRNPPASAMPSCGKPTWPTARCERSA